MKGKVQGEKKSLPVAVINEFYILVEIHVKNLAQN